MGMGSRDCVLVLWLLTMLLTLHSRSRMRRLKLSGTVQGLVQEPVALDDRTMYTLCAERGALLAEGLNFNGNMWEKQREHEPEGSQSSVNELATATHHTAHVSRGAQCALHLLHAGYVVLLDVLGTGPRLLGAGLLLGLLWPLGLLGRHKPPPGRVE